VSNADFTSPGPHLPVKPLKPLILQPKESLKGRWGRIDIIWYTLGFHHSRNIVSIYSR
jgi:hypothetical protein